MRSKHKCFHLLLVVYSSNHSLGSFFNDISQNLVVFLIAPSKMMTFITFYNFSRPPFPSESTSLSPFGASGAMWMTPTRQQFLPPTKYSLSLLDKITAIWFGNHLTDIIDFLFSCITFQGRERQQFADTMSTFNSTLKARVTSESKKPTWQTMFYLYL